MNQPLLRAAVLAAALLAGGLAGGAGARAANPDLGAEARAFVEHFMSEAESLLGDRSLAAGDRAQVFRGLLATGFDIDVISRYILDKHWYTATAAEREAFRRLFADYLYTVYEGHLGGLEGIDLRVIAARQKGDKGAQVRGRLMNPANGTALNLEWRLWQVEGGWRIVDVLVQGVSLVKAYREQFASLVDDSPGDVAAVLGALQDIAPAAGGN